MDIPNARTQHIPQTLNATKAALFVIILSLNFVLMTYMSSFVFNTSTQQLAPTSQLVLASLAILGLATLNGVIVLGMAVLAHDAVHNVLFRSRFANDAIGGLLSALSLIPFYANRQFHLSHHSYAHQEGLDPECTMHGRGYLFAFFVGPHVGIFLQQRKFLMNLVRGFSHAKYLKRFAKDFVFLHTALLYFLALVVVVGVSPLFAFLPTGLMFTIVFSFRAMSDHYGLPRVKRKSERRKEIGTQEELEAEGFQKEQPSGWVVLSHPMLEWLWSNVNYHEVHHKYPYLSYIHLPAVFEKTKETENYAVVQGFWRNLAQLWGRSYFG